MKIRMNHVMNKFSLFLLRFCCKENSVFYLSLQNIHCKQLNGHNPKLHPSFLHKDILAYLSFLKKSNLTIVFLHLQ